MTGIADETREQWFGSLGERFPQATALHAKRGLSANPAWNNVVRHCLLEAARAEALAGLLKLPAELAHDMALAAAVHDFYKREEVTAIQKDLEAGGTGYEASAQASQEASAILRNEGFSNRIIRLLACIGGYPEVLVAMHDILERSELNDNDLASLAVHYVDDATRGDIQAVPVEERNGARINEIDRREVKNTANPNYQKIREEIEKRLATHPFAQGKTGFEVMAEISHAIERRLTRAIKERGGPHIDPLELPEYIDSILR